MKMARIFALLTLFTLIAPTSAVAGIRGFHSGAEVGAFTDVNCGSGLNCAKTSGKFELSVSGAGTDVLSGFLQSQVASSATTLTADQCGSTIVGGGAHTVNLPEASAVLGCRFTFILAAASALTINPDDADQILLLSNAAGDAIQADAAGESVVLEAISATQWAPVGAEKGTWSDVN